MKDFMGIVIIGAGIIGGALALHFLASSGDVPVMAEDANGPSKIKPWPLQIDDPNIANAYNRAKYKDNILVIPEIYNNPASNFTNDFLHTYAPTVKQSKIPLQQL
jgi:prephenate dehydrogenase